MPTYEYRCKDCNHELEVQQAFSDEPLTECPSCNGALKKKFSAVGISFKGSGFYKTDSRGSSATATSSTKSDSTSESSSSESSSSGSSSSESAASTTSKDAASSPPKESSSGPSSTPAAASA